MDASAILGDLGDGLAAVAPTLASAFGGPLAGLAVTKVEQWLGMTPGDAANAPGAFQTALGAALANPAQVLLLKQEDDKFKQFCLDNKLQYAKVAAADTDSARNREIQVKDYTPRILAYVLTLMFAAAMASLIIWDIPPQNKDMFNILLGMLVTVWGVAVKYYFGSSASSQAKDDTISKLSA